MIQALADPVRLDRRTRSLEVAPTRVMIVGGQRLVADALAAILSRQPDMSVVANLASVAESAVHAASLKPHVVIAESSLEDGTAADLATSLAHVGLSTKLIFLAADESDSVMLAALDASASAVVLQSARTAEIVGAVRSVAAGLSLIQPAEVARLLRSWQSRDRARKELTNREREVLGLMARGLLNREIAAKMGVSYLTVRTHVRNLAVKLAARSQLETLVRARQLDLIETTAQRGEVPTTP